MAREKPRFAEPPSQESLGFELYGVGAEIPVLRLFIGRVPRRKKFALYAQDCGIIWVMAYFRNDTEAHRAMAILQKFIKVDS